MDGAIASGALASIRLIVSQLEAAAVLAQFAADDLDGLKASLNPGLEGNLGAISAELLRISEVLGERALFLGRIETDDLAERTAGDNPEAMPRRAARAGAG